VLPLLALTVVGGILRFATLDLQSFWYDEAVTVGIVDMSFTGMLGEIPDSESTPPLYYVVAWLWTKPFGTGEVGIRSLSALLGTAAIPAFYLAARELTRSNRAGLAVAALAAFNPLLVWYSQEARTYALMALLGALSLYFFARLLPGYDRGALVGWAITSALALTAHYFAGFLVVPEAVWLVWRLRRRPVWLAAGAVGAVGLALLPLALHQQSLDLASFIRTTALPYRLLRSGKQFLVGFEAPLEIALAVVAIAVVLAGIVVALRRPSPGVRTAAVLAGLGLALPLVLGLLGLDYLDTRNVLLAWLPLVTVACAGLVQSRAGLVGIGAVCAIGLACVVGVAVTPLWHRDNWRGAVEELGPARTNRAVVVTPRETAVVPFLLYAPDTEPRERTAAGFQEVALISKHGRTKNDIHPPDPPRPAHPALRGFTEARRVYAENFTLILFRRDTPLFLGPGQLAGARLLVKENAGVLLQRPVSGGEARARHRPGG
jgi:mannosyltransferase